MRAIPVMRPQLPSTKRLVPYLTKIDETRIYTNHGPLARAFEERLAEHFGLAPRSVTAVANATLGLALALAAQGAQPGTLCIIPAWTFVATAHAAVMAGLIPYFVDVDTKTWTLDSNRIDQEVARAPGPVSAVVPVAAFGQPVDVAAWDRIRSRTGLAVVIDAAAGFDSLRPGATPAVVSLHATKVLGVGEGGFVACTDVSLIRSIRSRANFGFHRTRQAVTSAVNAKLSEYHAAVGLAALDEWATVREEWMCLARAYRAALPDFGPPEVSGRVRPELDRVDMHADHDPCRCRSRRTVSGCVRHRHQTVVERRRPRPSGDRGLSAKFSSRHRGIGPDRDRRAALSRPRGRGYPTSCRRPAFGLGSHVRRAERSCD